MLKIQIKKLNDLAEMPTYAKLGDAGLDLTATSRTYKEGQWVYGTGLAIEIPQGYVGLIFPRSSLSKYDLMLTNHVGVTDSGYRGEIMFKFKELDNEDRKSQVYNIGDRIGQLIIIPYPQVEFIEVDELSSTERGTGGFGSTNN